MFEIIVAIIVVICIIYIFRGDFTRRDVGVTVLESLPLSIFKKWGKENNKVESYKEKKEEIAVETDYIEISSDENIMAKNDEVLNEVAITTIEEETIDIEINEEVIDIEEIVEEVSAINEENNIENVNEIDQEVEDKTSNDLEYFTDDLFNNCEDTIENKDIIENNNEEVEEVKEEDIVYWTPKGKTYHIKNTCRTLARSKVINSGTVYESGKDFKCEHCE